MLKEKVAEKYQNEAGRQIIDEILGKLTLDRAEKLYHALERNYILTTAFCLSWGNVEVYEEGFYINLTGTRCNFTAFYDDKNEIFIRKPRKRTLIWKTSSEVNLQDIVDDEWFDLIKRHGVKL